MTIPVIVASRKMSAFKLKLNSDHQSNRNA